MNAERELRVDCRLMERRLLLMTMSVLNALRTISVAESAHRGTRGAWSVSPVSGRAFRDDSIKKFWWRSSTLILSRSHLHPGVRNRNRNN